MKLPSLCEGHAPRHSADRVFLAAPDHSRAHLRGHQIQQLVDGRNHTSAFTAQNVSAAQYAKLWALGIPKMAATVLLSLCVQILLMASRREKTVSWDSSFIPLDHIFYHAADPASAASSILRTAKLPVFQRQLTANLPDNVCKVKERLVLKEYAQDCMTLHVRNT